ncbi:GxxExxY protein [Hymenobacter fastidiosus]|uniref:GxxExxY protein n=1 Tax=Hymenobacter fastidiosus TaxID=486264 RepID=A0ABP7SI99_9BACT
MLLDTRFNELTHRIIGCAMMVHRTLGNGFQEVIYQRSLAVELERAGLIFAREIEMPIFYQDVQVGARRVDFLVEQTVLVELKALTELNLSHYAQIINYLEAYHLEVGLLINFGEASLKHKRFLKNQPHPN